MKQRQHNEYFRTVSLGGRKSCPECHTKLSPGESVWSWGEYVNGKWRTVRHFCACCFGQQVRGQLNGHSGTSACTINLVGYGGEKLPSWLTLKATIELYELEELKAIRMGVDLTERQLELMERFL